MPAYIRTHIPFLCVLIGSICIFGYLTYSFTASNGRFSDVQNDLKTISPNETHAYTDLNGNKVQIRDYRGKPLIINSWASWTPFSRTELPLLARYAETYKDTLTILAINRMENVGVIRSYLSTVTVSDSLTILVDPTDYFYKAVSGYAMPETLFYDEDGNLIMHIRGVLTETVLNNMLATVDT
jgi:thiol-disulfide isomerase/thioredoxin